MLELGQTVAAVVVIAVAEAVGIADRAAITYCVVAVAGCSVGIGK